MEKEVRDKYYKHGVYSKETASEMARVCREFYDADIGVGVTGGVIGDGSL